MRVQTWTHLRCEWKGPNCSSAFARNNENWPYYVIEVALPVERFALVPVERFAIWSRLLLLLAPIERFAHAPALQAYVHQCRAEVVVAGVVVTKALFWTDIVTVFGLFVTDFAQSDYDHLDYNHLSAVHNGVVNVVDVFTQFDCLHEHIPRVWSVVNV